MSLLRRLARLLRPGRLDHEMEAEMRLHVELEAEELQRTGVAPEEARRRALATFGGIRRTREDARDALPLRWAGNIAADVRYGLRALRRAPSFTLAAVLALAVGIGANTAVFSFVDSLFFRPLAVREPGRLVALYGVQGEDQLLGFSWPSYEDLGRGARAFEGLAAFTEQAVSVGDQSGADVAWALHTSDNYFSLLGVPAALGTTYQPGDLRASVVVLGYAYWRNRFDGNPGVIGRRIDINGSPFTVVGVAPADFGGTRLFTYTPALWIPAGNHARTIAGSGDLLNRRDAATFTLLGRLKGGVSLAEARQSSNVVAAQLAADFPDQYAGLTTRVISNRTAINPWLAPPEWFGLIGRLALFGVSLVLFIACADVANLMLARMSVRRREIAVRLALGVSRRRLAQQLLTESVLLALIGAIAAVPLAAAGLRAMQAFGPHLEFPFLFRPASQGRVLAYTALVTTIAGLMCGLAPALQSSRPDVLTSLRDAPAARAGRWPRFREWLVAGQVMLSVIVLVTGGLFVRSLGAARRADPGFVLQGAAAFALDPQLSPAYDAAATRRLYDMLTTRLAELPGVSLVSRGASVPLDGYSHSRRIFVDGSPAEPARAPVAELNIVAPRWLETLGSPLLEGREFVTADTALQVEPVIVNQVLARRLWPSQPALGRRFRLGTPQGTEVEVIGVARVSKYRALTESPRAALWLSLDRNPRSRTVFVVRGANEQDLPAAIRGAVREVDPTLPIIGLGTLREHVSVTYSIFESGAFGALSFGTLAVLLACSGIFGVVSYTVSQRGQEIGIRIALGARAAQVLRLVLLRTLLLTVCGMAAGILVAVTVPMGFERLLVGVSKFDPASIAGAVLLFCVVALSAAALPAFRALRVDPMRALRLE